ncbi:MAG: hypothetical protein R2787_07410 [Saprospiraceae bacterium]
MSIYLFLLCSLLISSCQVQAQHIVPPQEVHPITEVVHDNEWYLRQVEAWTRVTHEEPGNAFAWYNRYKALRYADFPRIFQDTAYQAEVAKVVDEMGRAVPESFEYAYVRNWNAHEDPDARMWLDKAHAIDPSRPEVFSGYVTRCELEGQWEQMADYCRQWYNTHTLAPSLLHLAYNMLQSVDQNGILFTHGDNDTYPLWVLQHARNIRPDVTVINLSLASKRDYFLQLMAHRQIRINQAEIEQVFDTLPWEQKRSWMVQHLEQMNQDRPVYIALTVGISTSKNWRISSGAPVSPTDTRQRRSTTSPSCAGISNSGCFWIISPSNPIPNPFRTKTAGPVDRCGLSHPFSDPGRTLYRGRHGHGGPRLSGPRPAGGPPVSPGIGSRGLS